MILVGDIGGTKTELALFENVKQRKIVEKKRFESKKYSSLEAIIEDFLSSSKYKISYACFGIAGPVHNGVCKTTNLPWVVDSKNVGEKFGISNVFLLNDLEANAWGIFCLREDELCVLAEGDQDSVGNRALIAAGTGLGEAGLYFDGNKHSPFASEGGHCNFAPTNEEELEILQYLKTLYPHVSYERLLSGAGLANIYRFWIDAKKETELVDVKERCKTEDPAKVISEYGMAGKCPICVKAINRFASIYGSETGNVALKFFALGGVYIGGGIAPKILDCLKNGLFMDAFLKKGRLSSLLSKIRVQIVLNNETVLLGAAHYIEDKFPSCFS